MQKETSKIFILNRIKTLRFTALKNNLYKISLLFLSYSTVGFLFYSCSDAVSPLITTLDSPRYIWKCDTISTGLNRGIWASDTNNFLFIDGNNLYKYDGAHINEYQFINSFSGMCIDGFDKMNTYIGGFNTSDLSNRIDKWNGSIFQSYNIQDSIDENNIIYSIKAISPNNIWAGTSKGKLYHYNGVTATIYKIDTLAIFHFIVDNSDNLYCALENAHSSDPHYHDGTYTSIYKLTNNVWTKIYSHHYNETEDVLFPHELSGRFIAFTKKAAYEFIPSSFMKILDINLFYAFNDWGGQNMNNLINIGGTFNDPFPHLFHYNGSNWSDEIKLSYFNSGILFIQNKYFCVSNDPDYNTSIIYIGTSKK